MTTLHTLATRTLAIAHGFAWESEARHNAARLTAQGAAVEVAYFAPTLLFVVVYI